MPSTILARVDLRLELELPAAYSVLVQYADKPPTVEWNGVGHFRQQAAGYAARRGEFVDIRAALQLGSGLMVSQMANYLRGTAVPEYKCGFQVSLFVHFVLCIQSSKLKSFQHAGSRERVRGDIVRHSNFEAG